MAFLPTSPLPLAATVADTAANRSWCRPDDAAGPAGFDRMFDGKPAFGHPVSKALNVSNTLCGGSIICVDC